MTSEIKPRVDDDGVPWCDDSVKCPQRPTWSWESGNSPRYGYHCLVDGDLVMDESVCPHAVRRMAVENAAWRRGRLYTSRSVGGGDVVSYWVKREPWTGLSRRFDTIDAAVDALMEEE